MNPITNQTCRIQLLGGMRVLQGTRAITRFRTYKTGALLAYLAFFRRQTHPREALIELFWPDATPERGRNSLSICLSSLRNQLEPPGMPAGSIIIADRFSVGLNPEMVTTDVEEFETRLQRAENVGSDAQSFQLLVEAVESYGGPLLPGYNEDWIGPEQQRLVEAYVQALRRLLRPLLRRKEFDRALDYARRALSADPLREEAHRDLMRLYVAAGQPSAAFQQYQQLERTLSEALQVRPSATTRQLLREIETALQTPQETAPNKATVARAPQVASPQVVAAPMPPPSLPSGTVTFLLTDIAGSTARWERDSEAYRAAQVAHHTLLRRQFSVHNGQEVKDLGDGFLVVFTRAGDALDSALACQRALHQEAEANAEGKETPLQVRMALHTGEAEPEEGDYHALTVNRASRLLGAAHGGQILCSEATACLLRRDLEAGVRLTDLGVYRLRDLPLPERLFQVEWPQMPQRAFPAPLAEAGYASSLPLQFTRFFGREEELARLQERALEPETRLVTLTGPGGNGKTRLALEVARHLVEPFSGAVWFVPLGELTEARAIPNAIADALRLPREPGIEPMEQVVEALTRQSSLLVLDNFEQVVETGASVVQTLLTRVPTLTCLVTSRQQLNLSAERTMALAPLSTPNGTDSPERLSMYDSVQLFVDRAQSVRPDFQITGANAAAVAGLCDSLEGIPLAIELAAARAQVLTPAQMLAQLQNRFEFLVSRKRDAAERHRTLRAAVEWSYRLLAPELQSFFARLSVFRGGWTSASASAVAGRQNSVASESGEPSASQETDDPLTLDFLAQLQECSLVQMTESGDTMRYQMLETLREFAEGLLTSNEQEALRQRHATCFLNLAEEAERDLSGPKQVACLDLLEQEYDNLRAALRWMADRQEIDRGLRMGSALFRFWEVRGHFAEGREWLALFLGPTRPDATVVLPSAPRRAKALRGAGRLALRQGDMAEARALYEESLAMNRALDDRAGIVAALHGLAQSQPDDAAARALVEQEMAIAQELEDPKALVAALSSLAHQYWDEEDFTTARTLYLRCLDLYREAGDTKGIATTTMMLGFVAMQQGDYATAATFEAESLSLSRELRDKEGIASAVELLGAVAYAQGDYRKARPWMEESLALRREKEDAASRFAAAFVLRDLGLVACGEGAFSESQALLAQSLAVFLELNNQWTVWNVGYTLAALAVLAQKRGQTMRATRLWGAAKALRDGGEYFLSPTEYALRVSDARTALGAEAFEAAWNAGASLTLEQAVACALDDTQ